MGLNPLNQVYVFNAENGSQKLWEVIMGLNPLNQVYVFNEDFIIEVDGVTERLNPLNQVYVFNGDGSTHEVVTAVYVLIP